MIPNPKKISQALPDEINHDNDFVYRCSLAKCQDTPPQELDILARDKDPIVRRLVAGNYSTSPETLDYLSYDTDEDVIKGIANNPVAWATTLKRISRPDEINHDMLFSSIISNPFISPDKFSSITKSYNCMKPNKNHTS